MRRHEFEHVIAAAAEVSAEREIVVIGSQAILGSVEDPPATMLLSMEADVYPRNAPDKAEEIDGSLGDGSPFHGTHGYYAHGVGPETAVAPAGWEERLVRMDIPPRAGRADGAVALCLEVHDLVRRSALRAGSATGCSQQMRSLRQSFGSMTSSAGSKACRSRRPIENTSGGC